MLIKKERKGQVPFKFDSYGLVMLFNFQTTPYPILEYLANFDKENKLQVDIYALAKRPEIFKYNKAILIDNQLDLVFSDTELMEVPPQSARIFLLDKNLKVLNPILLNSRNFQLLDSYVENLKEGARND